MRVLASLSLLAIASAQPGLAQSPGSCSLSTAEGVSWGGTWSAGLVPFEFASTVTSAQRAAMAAAMQQVESAANVRFLARAAEADYVWIRDSSVNSSQVGRVGGMQVLHIADWQNTWSMVHQLLHVLGFWHEQQRPDRDQFVAVQWANIDPADYHLFQIVPLGRTFGPYDFDSLMHFGATENSTNSLPTLLVLPPNQQQQSAIGQRTHLSTGDVDALRLTYGSPIPPTIQSMTPSATTAWNPGSVLLQGLLFDEVRSVSFGPLRTTSFSRPAANQILVAVPSGLPIGQVPVTVESLTGSSAPAVLVVTGNEPPVLEGPAVVVRGTFQNQFRNHGDHVRATWLLVSLQDAPSAIPGVVQLDIGASFTDIALLGGPIVGDPSGVATFRFTVPSTLAPGTLVHMQTVMADLAAPLFPLSVSNRVSPRAF